MANLVTSKCTSDSAEDTQDRADYQWLVSRRAENHAGESSGDCSE
jgi:hypothetical protein